MSAARAPLSVLDLSPIPRGSSAADAIAATLALAQSAEQFGYARYWLAEHHLHPGLAGSNPLVLAGIVAAHTRRIRVGTAATLIAHHPPAQIAEALGVLAAFAGDRIDLGLARPATPPPGGGPAPGPNRVVDGLVLAEPRGAVIDPELARLPGDLLGRAVAVDGFTDALTQLLELLDGRHATPDGRPVDVPPATSARAAQLWLHGSTPGGTAQLAGRLGLRFGASYHSQPWAVPEAVAAYRAAFRPSPALAAPRVIVSADVVVAETDARARELAAGYAEWVLGIRSGRGAPPYPAPGDGAGGSADAFTDAERLLVQDRLDTRFVGTPEHVVERLETLQRVTAADELVVTTITHDPDARRGSYRLLAEAWGLAGSPA